MVHWLTSFTQEQSCPTSKMTSRWTKTNGIGNNGRRTKRRASNPADNTELPAAVNREVKTLTGGPNRAARAPVSRARTYSPMIPTVRAARSKDGASDRRSGYFERVFQAREVGHESCRPPPR